MQNRRTPRPKSQPRRSPLEEGREEKITVWSVCVLLLSGGFPQMRIQETQSRPRRQRFLAEFLHLRLRIASAGAAIGLLQVATMLCGHGTTASHLITSLPPISPPRSPAVASVDAAAVDCRSVTGYFSRSNWSASKVHRSATVPPPELEFLRRGSGIWEGWSSESSCLVPRKEPACAIPGSVHHRRHRWCITWRMEGWERSWSLEARATLAR